MTSPKVLVAGATGYLGNYIVQELKSRGYWVRVLIRKESQKQRFENVDDFFVGQITDSKSLQGVTKHIDWIFSTIGITRQKDHLTYMQVDYQGNSNLLKEALKENVTSFLYVSALNGNQLKHLKIFEAKEKFVEELTNSTIHHCIMRPNGFFSDMKDFLWMAKKGRMYLFGEGNYKLNPIHGADLAKVCIDSLREGKQEVTAGGMDIFTQNELATLALQAWSMPIKITHLPDWTRKLTIFLFRTFTSSKTYGPIEFFLTAMANNNIADTYGTHKLADFFNEEVTKLKQTL
ncbi:SDR family oxidoreductase [Tenacibaculum sp. TC6]|uniref:SDR family oxidoreductase n=1 Tax=Tenacibaculum sp. TC6 TaxID=3423223 RepID=UPI003D36AE39